MIGVRNGILIEFIIGALIIMAWNLGGCTTTATQTNGLQLTCPETPGDMSLGEFADSLSRCVEKVG